MYIVRNILTKEKEFITDDLYLSIFVNTDIETIHFHNWKNALNINSFNIRKHNPNKEWGKRSSYYYKKVNYITEKNAVNLKGIELRGWDKKHVDHIVPVSYGESHNIPEELIGSLENLQMLDKIDNMDKGNKITDKAEELLKKWGYFSKS